MSRGRDLVALLATAPGLAACATAPTPMPAQGRLPVPAGWTEATEDGGALRVALPPWLVAFDTTNAVFANEPPSDGGPGMQLLAEPPRSVEPQLGPVDDLRTWLTVKLEDVGSGTPVFRNVVLPAGAAVVIDRTDRAGTPQAWRHRAWAIRTPAGVAYLWIDGPPDAWDGREADIDRIATLVEIAR